MDLFSPKLVSAFKKDLEAVTNFLVGETKSRSKSPVKKATKKRPTMYGLDHFEMPKRSKKRKK